MMSCRRGMAMALTASALALSGAANAADWQFDPSLELGALIADNYTLANSGAPSADVAGPLLDVSATLRGKSPRTEYLLEPRFRAAHFPDDSELNSESGYFRFKVDHNGEKSRIGLDAKYADEFIVDSELLVAGPGNGDLGQGGGPESGHITQANRRRLIEADPYLQFSLNERTRLRFDASGMDVSFDTEVFNAQQSYQSLGISGTLAHDVSPSSALSVTLGTYNFNPDRAGPDVKTNSLLLQWDYRIAERVRAYFRGGVSRTEGTLGADAVNTPLYGVGAQWTFQRSQLFFDVLRDVAANSTGFVVASDVVRLWGTHQFTTRLSGFAAIYAVRDESVRSSVLYNPREYVSASAGVDWRVFRQVTLSAQYSHAYQDYRHASSSAYGDTFQASVVWRPYRVD